MAEQTPAGSVLDAAVAIAAAAPAKPGSHVFASAIPWGRIHELRDALDALGIEWRD